MIPNQWYPILDATKLRERPRAVRRLGMDLVLWRRPDGRVVAQRDRCPHKGARLSDGRVVGDEIRCPYHGFRFDAAGTCVAAPCLGTTGHIPEGLRVESLQVREENQWIWLWYGDADKVRPELPIVPELRRPAPVRARICYDRPIHYTRYIESLLEFYHVSWVHAGRWYNSLDHFAIAGVPSRLFIGSKRRYENTTKVVHHECKVEGERIDAIMDMGIENDPLEKRFRWHVTFLAPCLVYLETHLFRAGQYMTPIDDENTHVMMDWLEFKPLSWLLPDVVHRNINRLTMLLQWLGQDDQDYRIMLGQTPKVSDVGVNRFVAVDELNSRFLQMRRRLIREAQGVHLSVLDEERPAEAGGAA